MSLQHGLSLEPVPGYVYMALEEGMRVDDLVRKTVVFVGYETAGRFVPYGTGLLCWTRFDDVVFNFIATPAHVFNKIPGNFIDVRLNRKDGGSNVVRIDKKQGIHHEKQSVDLVLISVKFGIDIYDTMEIELSREALAKFGSGWQYGIGDEVCVTGLYTSHSGYIRNIPVIRIGHISAMPEEPIQTDNGYVEGYIIELHSIAGLSGSPVFTNSPPVWWSRGRGLRYRAGDVPIPIGILIGHHEIESKEDQILVEHFQPDGATEPSVLSSRNTGFGVVIPLERVTEIMERPDVVKSMRTAVEHHRQKSGFVPDGRPEDDSLSGNGSE